VRNVGYRTTLLLHTDHKQNASTSTVHKLDLQIQTLAMQSAGIASLSVSVHGGANEAVIKMLAEGSYS
jgi:citrate synthase